MLGIGEAYARQQNPGRGETLAPGQTVIAGYDDDAVVTDGDQLLTRIDDIQQKGLRRTRDELRRFTDGCDSRGAEQNGHPEKTE
jgi:hypothetical protein